jgi:formylglycine-generating enzyme required for sulfatase activity/regulator of sirC expression with transglutaminase-like and TPR domain
MKRNRRSRVVIALLQFALVVSFLPVAKLQAQKAERARLLVQPEVKAIPAKAKRWALIIGVDKYDDENITPLKGATNDANALAAALRDHAGFDENQVIVLTNEQKASRQPTRRNILKYLSNLKGLVPKDGLFLISFSGHGIERDGRAFLIPYDATYTDDPRLLEETAISADVIKRDIKESGVSQVLILLDACRNDPAGGKADSINPLTEAYLRGFEFDVRNREVTAFATLYATSIGTRAYEDVDKKEGYFTLAVVEALRGKAADPTTGEVTLQSLVRYVETNVPARVAINLGGRKVQKPFAVIEGFRASELVLAIGNSKSTAAGSGFLSGELTLWREVEKSDSEEAYEAFLKAYPAGEYAAVATYKLQGAKKRTTLAMEYYKRGVDLRYTNEDEALVNFTKALELNPNYAGAYRERGGVHANTASTRKKPEENDLALADYNKAIELNPNDEMVFNLRGILFGHKNANERAIADYTRSIELAPKTTPALFNRAGIYRTIGRNDLAIADYSRYLEIERVGFSKALAHRGRGQAYLANKKYELALADFNKAIESAPQEGESYGERGRYYAEVNDYAKAIADYTKAIDLLTGTPWRSGWYQHVYYQGRGRAYFSAGNYSEAIADYTKSIKSYDSDASVYRDRSKAYEASGDKNKAAADRKTAEDLDRRDTSESRPDEKESVNSGGNVSEPAGAERISARPPPSFKTPQGIEMVYIPAGSFVMGSSEAEVQRAFAQLQREYGKSDATLEWFRAQTPPHQVTIREGFYLGRYEVTQAQWRQVMGTNPSKFKDCDQCPVENVWWNDAQNFITKMNALNDGYSYRLPSEAEWEYACRAGMMEDVGDLDVVGWYYRNSGDAPLTGEQNSDLKTSNHNRTHPVGQKQPNGFGLYDMHGNVAEWCQDLWHKNYKGAPVDGSAWGGSKSSGDRVHRGGSWSADAVYQRPAHRFALDTNELAKIAKWVTLDIGIRLVAVPDGLAGRRFQEK